MFYSSTVLQQAAATSSSYPCTSTIQNIISNQRQKAIWRKSHWKYRINFIVTAIELNDCVSAGNALLFVEDQELSQRVFMVLYRMSSNQDLAACASESFSSKEHTDLLLGKRLLDMPKLMNVCAIYGHDNAKASPIISY